MKGEHLVQHLYLPPPVHASLDWSALFSNHRPKLRQSSTSHHEIQAPLLLTPGKTPLAPFPNIHPYARTSNTHRGASQISDGNGLPPRQQASHKLYLTTAGAGKEEGCFPQCSATVPDVRRGRRLSPDAWWEMQLVFQRSVRCSSRA